MVQTDIYGGRSYCHFIYVFHFVVGLVRHRFGAEDTKIQIAENVPLSIIAHIQVWLLSLSSSGEITLKELSILGSKYGEGEISIKQGETVTWSRPKQDVKNILQQL